MATSGTLGTLSGSYKTTYTVTWSLLSQSTANNASTIRLTGTLYTGNTTTISSSYSTFKLDGTTVYSGSYSKSGSGNVFVKTKDITVKHNSDGSFPGRTVSFSTNDYVMGSQSGSGKITGVATIPRASTVACSSPYIGDTATITISRKSSSFTHNVSYHIGELTGTIADNTKETVLSLDTSTLKEQIYALIPNAKSIAATIRCRTYSGSTKIGDTAVANFNLYAKEDECRPDVSGTVVDTNEATIALTGDSSKLIKYISKPKVTIEATAKNSATISSYSINLNDGQSSTLQENTFESIGSNNITVNATDSRGYSNPQTIELEMINYVKLHIDNIDISRTEDVSNEVILNANGVWFNGNFNDENVNTLTASFQYKSSDSTEWIDGGTLTPTIKDNTFTFTDVSLGNIYDYNNEYQFKIVLSDLLMTVGSENKEEITVPKGQEVVAIGEDTVWVYGDLFLNDENILDKIPDINILTATPTQQTINGTDVQVVLYKNEQRSIGDKLSVESGKIKIGAGVSLIKLDLKIGGQVSGTAISGSVGGKLRKNGEAIMQGYTATNLSAYASASIDMPSIIIEVKEGDLIDFVCSASANFVINSSYSQRSYVTVEVIK